MSESWIFFMVLVIVICNYDYYYILCLSFKTKDMGIQKHKTSTNIILDSSFFVGSSIAIAKNLLGKYLVRVINGKKYLYRIIEVEAYGGFNDKASHARHGKTERNSAMFQGPGTIYVYFTYGMHWMLNIVCGPVGFPSAILIRGIEGFVGP